VSSHSRLTGLDAATGQVRWSLRLPVRGLLGDQAATADGGLAMITTAGVLQVVSLADGRIRWRRTAGASPALTAAGQLVIFSINGRLTGYDDRTGQPRWTTGGPAGPAAPPGGRQPRPGHKQRTRSRHHYRPARRPARHRPHRLAVRHWRAADRAIRGASRPDRGRLRVQPAALPA